jgi:benzoyl-CoA reductase/2-hydroxyglutaryl-CoA dehydratase subunit BcrC/BadD/HgdB
MSNTMAAILNFLACTKLSFACKFACGLRKLHATLIMFCNNTERTKIKIYKIASTLKILFTVPPLIKTYPTQSLSGPSNLVQQYR